MRTVGSAYLSAIIGFIVIAVLSLRQVAENWFPGTDLERAAFDTATIELPIPHLMTEIDVVRLRRDPCAKCHRRRVLYRIRLGGYLLVRMTEARCRTCWRMTE